MIGIKRRDLLRFGAALGATTLASSTWTKRGNASTFGDVPAGGQSSMLPENLQAQSVLECFLSGGLTPWDSFYCRPDLGEVSGTFAYAAYNHLIKASEGCGFSQAGAQPFTAFAKDSAQEDIFFGPYMGRLLARPDVMKRLRVVVTRHRETVHEGASALATTGRPHSHPAAAGLATHVNRFFVDRDATSRATPFAYSFAGGSGFTFTGPLGTVAQGLHPGRARPLELNLQSLARKEQVWSRSTVGTVADQIRYDALLEEYFNQYRGRLEPGGEPLRAPGFDDLKRAFAQQKQTNAYRNVVLESPVVPWATDPMCEVVVGSIDEEPRFALGTGNTPGPSGNIPAMGLKVATQLLTHPTQPARYCSVTDVGVQQADGGGGYDAHSQGPWRQAMNLNSLLQHLLGFINAPGETDPRKLDLNKTLIILNTEFGRSPALQTATGLGRAHWPGGFVQIYIGGPIRNGNAGCYGHIDEEGIATTFTTPAENRIAALLALGIYPFDGEGVAFAHSDVLGAADDAAAIRAVQQKVFGVMV